MRRARLAALALLLALALAGCRDDDRGGSSRHRHVAVSAEVAP